LCGSRKYPPLHHRELLEILRRRGVLKAKSFKGKYGPKLEFSEGWGVETQKSLPWGDYGYFLEQHILRV